jgi:hypothetical protein
MKSKFKHIYMDHIGLTKYGESEKGAYEIRNNKSDDLLGYISWYDDWNQYVFESFSDEIIFSVSCLQDICEFIGELK